MKQSLKSVSPIRRQAADALRRARRLPLGHDRNDLRQLAVGLLWLEKRGFVAFAEDGRAQRAQAEGNPSEIALVLRALGQGALPSDRHP
jgi:hypothetical protein